MKTVPYRALDHFLSDRAGFEQRYGVLDPDKADRLARILKFTDAVRIGSATKLEAVAELYLHPSEVRRALEDPAAYLQGRVNPIASKAEPVLWKESKSKRLSAAIFCPDILVATAVLTLFRIASTQPGGTGQCVICGKLLFRERGYRRRTCSDRCRTKLSRKNRQRREDLVQPTR